LFSVSLEVLETTTNTTPNTHHPNMAKVKRNAPARTGARVCPPGSPRADGANARHGTASRGAVAGGTRRLLCPLLISHSERAAFRFGARGVDAASDGRRHRMRMVRSCRPCAAVRSCWEGRGGRRPQPTSYPACLHAACLRARWARHLS
jgi:hypothetical protein